MTRRSGESDAAEAEAGALREYVSRTWLAVCDEITMDSIDFSRSLTDAGSAEFTFASEEYKRVLDLALPSDGRMIAVPITMRRMVAMIGASLLPMGLLNNAQRWRPRVVGDLVDDWLEAGECGAVPSCLA